MSDEIVPPGGGRGFIGGHLTRMLLDKGHDVTHISRNPSPQAITWSNLTKNGLPKNTEAVVNLSGNNLMDITKRFDAAFKTELKASRVDTNEMIVRAISQSNNPPKVFVAASGVGYYEPSETAEYTEDSVSGVNAFFLSKLSKEVEASAQLPASTTTRSVVVRIGLALGRNGGAIQQMIFPFCLGLGGRLSTGKQWFPWIHVHDVAGIIIHSIENDKVTGVLNATAPHYINNAEFTKAFAKQLWRPAVFPVPKMLLNIAYGPERAETLLTGAKVIPKKTIESGYQFMYPDIQSACKEFARFLHPDVRIKFD